MTRTTVVLLLLSFVVGGIFAGCTARQDAAIREKTDLGMDNLTKAKDIGIEGTVRTSLASNPVFKFYGLDCTVSHDMITIIGKVKTEKQKKEAFELVASIDHHRIKAENIINDIVVDPSLDEPPFEW